MADNQHLQTYQSLSTELYDINKPTVASDEFAFYLNYVKQCQDHSLTEPSILSSGKEGICEGPECTRTYMRTPNKFLTPPEGKRRRFCILEPMCGSGRFLIPLIEAGYDIHGFDASPFMLDALHKKCAAKNLKPTVWHSWAQNLNTPERYGLVFIPDGSLNLILDLDDLQHALKKIYKHLLPNGRFVFELVTLRYADHIQVGSSNTFSILRPDGKRIIQTIEVLPFNGPIAKTFSRYDLLDNDHVLKSETETFQLHLHDPKKIHNYLQAIGFRNIKRLKPFYQNQTADSNDPIIIFECMK